MGLFWSDRGREIYRLLTEEKHLWEQNLNPHGWFEGIKHPSGLILHYQSDGEFSWFKINGSDACNVLKWWEHGTIEKIVFKMQRKFWLEKQEKEIDATLKNTRK